MSEIVLLFLEKICEAIYFSAFLIIGKGIKEKRILFTAIMIFEYLALKHFIHYNIWFQLIYTFMSFVNLKVLYKDKAQVTDIFLFAIASIILIIFSIVFAILAYFVFNNYYICLILDRISIMIFIFLVKDKIQYIYNKFCSVWNRRKKNDKIKIRSLTVRNVSIIFFNLMFWLINICLTIILLTKK